MINFIKNIFSKKKTLKSNHNQMESYYRREIERCGFIKPEKVKVVIEHLNQEINLNKTGNKFSVEEKRKLGINTRLSITKELIDILNQNGINQDNPKDILTSLFCNASFKKTRDEQLKQFKDMGINHYKLMACNDERDCSWCKSMNNKKLSLNQDINFLIEQNCSCNSHCRLIVQAEVDLESIGESA